MQQITSTVDVDGVLERIGVGRNEELRQSTRRRRYLEKLSRVITPQRPNVELDSNHPTACVNQTKNEPYIRITTREFDQTATDFSRDVYDMTVQEALLVHEVGHILYTDHGAFQRTLSRVPLSLKSAYKRLWNTLEDGAIEEQLRRRFNVENELYVLNANLMTDKQVSETDEEADAEEEFGGELDLYAAVSLGCMDMAVFDSGKFAKLRDENDDSLTMRSPVEAELLDELVPIMRDAVADIKTEAEPVKRTEKIYEFWVEVEERLEQAQDQQQEQQTPGDDSSGDEGEEGDGLGSLFSDPDEGDGEQEGGDGDQTIMPIPKPDDSENADVGGGQSADELEQQDEEDVREQAEATADPDSEETDFDDDGDEGEAGAGDDDGDEKEGEGAGSDGDERRESIEENRREQLREEASEVDGAQQLMDDVEEYGEVLEDINAAGDYPGEVKLRIPDSVELDDRQKWQDAKRRSRQITQRLQSSLREERRSRRVKNQRRGRFDRSRMINAERGSARVFEREQEGNEKNYDCIIVLDRSGSMGGDRIETAEGAITSLALALEEVGIGVGIIGMHSNNARLENAFGRSVEDDAGLLLSRDVRGGTPLAKTLGVARERLERKGDTDNPFLIVVTDGQPGDPDAYREQLDKCTFPVLGVYVDTIKDDNDYFHRQVHVTQDDLQQSLTQLAREVVI